MPAEAKLVPPNSPMAYSLLHRAISLTALALLLLPSALVAFGEQSPNNPLVVPITIDNKTYSVYTVSIKNDGAPLVVDLAGSLVWSTCPSAHTTVPCHSDTCRAAANDRPRRCRYVDAGRFWATREPTHQPGCACTAHPSNPVSGKCSAGDLTTFAMSANATNGSALLQPESFAAVGSCSPDRLTRQLPAGAAGVAGFSG